jgi:hypothetical protein
MAFIIVANGEYYGPFPTRLRAIKYGENLPGVSEWRVEELIVPFVTVVNKIIWVGQ